jgi:hypothetical protein
VEAKVVEIDRRKVVFEFSVTDPVGQCGRDSTCAS